MGELSHKSWQNLVKLTGENVTDEGLAALLRQITNTDKLDDLDEAQAQQLLAAISPLPGLRAMLWEGCVQAVDEINGKLPKGVVSLDSTAAAEVIVPHLLDRLAGLLVKQSQLGMSLHDETPKNG